MTCLSKKTHCSVCTSSMTRKTFLDKKGFMTLAAYWCDNKHCDNVLTTVIKAAGKIDDPKLFYYGVLGRTENMKKNKLLELAREA